jgi:endonuclease IV
MIGVHVSKNSKVLDNPNKKRKTILDAIKKDTTELGINVVQIFTHGPRNTKETKDINPELIKKYCEENKICLYVHSAYMAVGIWHINKKNIRDTKSKNAIEFILAQLNMSDKLNSMGLVIHLPKKEPDVIISTFEVLLPIIKKYKTPIILEMTAVLPDPNKTYETPLKINRLTMLMHKKFPDYDNWGWCIDTAHLWGAGIKVNDINVMKKWFDAIKIPEYVKLIHLNGASKSTFATGKDKHIVVFSDEDDIWKNKKKKKSSLDIIQKFVKNNNINVICEINRGDYKDILSSIKILKEIFN